MTLNINQFKLTPVQGLMQNLGSGSNVFTMQIDPNSSATYVPGQAVKIVNTAGGVPQVTALTANTDEAVAFICYDQKNPNWTGGDYVEVALYGSVMYMTAGAAINRFAKVEVVYNTNKVIANAGTNPVVGFAFDKALADNDLIRVYIQTASIVSAQTIEEIAGLPDALDTLQENIDTVDDSSLKIARVTATLEEINTGKVLVAGVAGKAITVTNFAARVNGNFTTNTSVDIQDESATKVAVLTQADLDTDVVLIPVGGASGNVGAGFAAPLAIGEDLVVANVGDPAAGGTSITFTITYKQA